jgi:hypothetical protein
MDTTTVVSLVVLGVLLVLYMMRRKSRLNREGDMD